eukprot:470561_1
MSTSEQRNDPLKTKRIYLVKGFIRNNYALHFHSILLDIVAAYCEQNECVWRLYGTNLQRLLNANTRQLHWNNTMEFRDIKNDIHLVFELHLFGRKESNQEIVFCWRLQEANPRAFLLVNYRLECEEWNIVFESKTVLNIIGSQNDVFNTCHGCSHTRSVHPPDLPQITHLTFCLEIIDIKKVEKYWKKYPNRLACVNKDSYPIYHLNGKIYMSR